MSTTHHVYIDPNGTEHKRSSQSMRYSHVIVRRTSNAENRRGLQRLIDQYQGWSLNSPSENRHSARLAELHAELEGTPIEGATYAVSSWSQSEAQAHKRCKADQFVAPVTITRDSVPRR